MRKVPIFCINKSGAPRKVPTRLNAEKRLLPGFRAKRLKKFSELT